MSQRHTTQLPSSEELQRIMDAEAKRNVPALKLNVHYPDFRSFSRALESFELSSEVIAGEFTQKTWIDGQCLERADRLLEQLIAKVTTIVLLEDRRSLLDAMYDYLAEQDAIRPADVIFVFGAKTPLRIEKAVELYHSGFAKKLVLSGRASFTSKADSIEAETYRAYAIAHGVPEEAILVEPNSITIPDNVRSSLNLFDDLDFHPKSFIIVNSPYSQRRGWCLFKKYLPDDVALIRQNCDTAKKYSRDEWYKTPDGIRVVANEFIKMKVAVVLNTA